MPDFVESAKHFVSSAVSRTSWEAQKQMRVRGKQGEIDKLLDQRHQLLDELGQIAMTLYQQGNLPDPQLSRICAGIMELDNDVRNRETQLQDIKKEAYAGDQLLTMRRLRSPHLLVVQPLPDKHPSLVRRLKSVPPAVARYGLTRSIVAVVVQSYAKHRHACYNT